MSFVVLRADALATALTDDPVVPAADVAVLTDAMALLAAAARVHDDANAAVARAVAAGHAEGFAEGQREGRAAVAADLDAERFALALRDSELQRQRQDAIGRLALEVVRKIAGTVGADETMAGIVARATADIAPDTAVTVRIHPDVVATVTARIGDRPGMAIEADPSLAPLDCVIETALARVQAGLETQLAQIERHWVTRDG